MLFISNTYDFKKCLPKLLLVVFKRYSVSSELYKVELAVLKYTSTGQVPQDALSTFTLALYSY